MSGYDAVNSKVCGRCGGSGHYSYNQLDGTTCYGCMGTGRVLVTPKGQPKVKETAPWLDTGSYSRGGGVGDIVEINRSLHRITRITWRQRANSDNQRVEATRLVDGKEFAYRRCAMEPCRDSYITITDVHGNVTRAYAYGNITVSETMEGQDATRGDDGEWVQF